MKQRRSWLLELAVNALKYSFLSLVGCTLAYNISAYVLEWWLVAGLIVIALEHLLLRGLILVGCLWAIAVIVESLQN